MRTYTIIMLYTQDMSHVLLVKKQKGPSFNIGKWDGIGCRKEEYESLYGCAASEVQRAVKINPQQDCTVFEHFNTFELAESSLFRAHEAFKFYAYYGRLKEGVAIELKSADGGEELKWFESADLHNHRKELAGWGRVLAWHELILARSAGR